MCVYLSSSSLSLSATTTTTTYLSLGLVHPGGQISGRLQRLEGVERVFIRVCPPFRVWSGRDCLVGLAIVGGRGGSGGRCCGCRGSSGGRGQKKKKEAGRSEKDKSPEDTNTSPLPAPAPAPVEKSNPPHGESANTGGTAVKNDSVGSPSDESQKKGGEAGGEDKGAWGGGKRFVDVVKQE